MLRHQVLRQTDIVQQCTCRANRNGVFFAVQTEAAQILAAEIFRQQFFPRVGGKLPRVQARNTRCRLKLRCVFTVRQQNFRRLQARQFVVQFIHSCQLGFEFAALQRCPRQTDVFFVGGHGNDAVGFLVFQQCGIGQRAGRYDAHDFALHRSFACADFADLFANRHAFAQLDQARQILFGGVKRHACHFDRLAIHLSARGQGNIQKFCRFYRIVEKHLVKIAHTVKHQFVGMLRFDAEVLLHHWGNGGFGHGAALSLGKRYCSKRFCLRRNETDRKPVNKVVETTRKTAKLSTEILLSQKTSTLICLIQQVLNSNLFDKKIMKILDICYLRTSRLAIIKIIIKI